MKKESLKNEIGSMLENAQDVYEFREYGELMVERHIKVGNFKATFVSAKDEESRRFSEEQILKRAAQVNRQLRHFSAAELNRRSNLSQEALFYISEHRHLIPFFRFVDDLQRNQKKTVGEAVREWKKKYKCIPDEVTFQSWGFGSQGCYTLGHNAPDILTVVSQVDRIPIAWTAA